jgi:Fe-S cluster assembly ATP-binding protein
MLRIESLKVNVGENEILHGVNLEIPAGETHVLFGPNGSGKTSLLSAIMGLPDYRVTEGKITFNDQDITKLPINQRAKLGIGMSFQRPPTIRGLNMRQMIEICSASKTDLGELASYMNLDGFLDRDVNLGFSGGETKRTELLQLLAQEPNLVLIDEPESGVDLESITLIGRAINRLLNKDVQLQKRRRLPKKSGLIITHTGYILDYVRADRGYVMCDGIIGCSGHPQELLEDIRRLGYEECVACHLQRE